MPSYICRELYVYVHLTYKYTVCSFMIMERISLKWENDKVGNMQDKYASQRKAIMNPEVENNEGRSTLSVKGIPEAEDFFRTIFIVAPCIS